MKVKLRKALCPSVPKSPLVLIKGVGQKLARSLITPMFHLSCGQKSKPFGEVWNWWLHEDASESWQLQRHGVPLQHFTLTAS